MNEIHSPYHPILKHLAERDIPPESIDLWNPIQARLLPDGTSTRRKEPVMFSPLTQRKWFRLVTAIVLGLLITIGLLISTPQGQALAQNVLRFFTRGRDTLPLPSWPTSTPVAMIYVTPGISQPTQAASPTITLTPMSDLAAICGDFLNPQPTCSVSQIRKLVNFPVKALAATPPGMIFVNVTWVSNSVVMVYRSEDRMSGLTIIQKPDTHQADQSWEIPSSVPVEVVQFGKNSGEYVIGGWSHMTGDRAETWDSNADQTLRWEEDGVLITLSQSGSQDLPGMRLDKDGLVRLASAMTTQADASAPQPTLTPTLVSTQGMAEMEKSAGFKVIQPAWLPKDYWLDQTHITADGKAVCLEYGHPDDAKESLLVEKGNFSLSILESLPGSLPTLSTLFPFLPKSGRFMNSESWMMGGAINNQAMYASGTMDPGKLCGNSYDRQVLSVMMDNLQFMIFSRIDNGDGLHNFLTRQQTLRLAESITGVSTIPEDQLDPEFITSLADAERLFGLHIKLPTQLPDGRYFDHFSFSQIGNSKSIRAFYGGGGTPFSVMVMSGASVTLDEMYSQQPGVYDRVKVRGTDGIISQGVYIESGFKMMPDGGDGGASLKWFEDGLEYSIGGYNAYPRSVWLQIAESMK